MKYSVKRYIKIHVYAYDFSHGIIEKIFTWWNTRNEFLPHSKVSERGRGERA